MLYIWTAKKILIEERELQVPILPAVEAVLNTLRVPVPPAAEAILSATRVPACEQIIKWSC